MICIDAIDTLQACDLASREVGAAGSRTPSRLGQTLDVGSATISIMPGGREDWILISERDRASLAARLVGVLGQFCDVGFLRKNVPALRNRIVPANSVPYDGAWGIDLAVQFAPVLDLLKEEPTTRRAMIRFHASANNLRAANFPTYTTLALYGTNNALRCLAVTRSQDCASLAIDLALVGSVTGLYAFELGLGVSCVEIVAGSLHSYVERPMTSLSWTGASKVPMVDAPAQELREELRLINRFARGQSARKLPKSSSKLVTWIGESLC